VEKKNVKLVLIVDDDVDDRLFFCEALAEINPVIECLTAKDGMEALDKLNKCATLPDFIFLDSNMPRMDGKKCLEELKKSNRYISIPVIMYSTSKNEEDMAISKRLGALAFIKKPVFFEEIRDTIAHVLSGEWEKIDDDMFHTIRN
jgi:CheY-like chemotaxis protein